MLLRHLRIKVICACLISCCSVDAQDLAPKDSLVNNKVISLIGAEALSVGSYIALNNVWYKDYEKVDFHFFNDLAEWRGMDKLGHVTTSYVLAEQSSRFFKAFGWQDRSDVLGGIYGFTYTSSLEILDAYSKDWGFSWYDVGSNFIGASSFVIQEKIWGKQKFRFKWSFSRSKLASQNTSLLGSTRTEEIIKDYNGQTYWVSFPVSEFSRKSMSPEWLHLSFGYGIHDMVRARESLISGVYEPRSQYYLSLDVDWSAVKIRNRHLKGLFKTLNFIKIPFPALQWDKSNGLRVNPIHF